MMEMRKSNGNETMRNSDVSTKEDRLGVKRGKLREVRQVKKMGEGYSKEWNGGGGGGSRCSRRRK